MTLRSRIITKSLLAAGLGLGMAQYLPAQEPARLNVERDSTLQAELPANQQIANTIAAQLRNSGQLRHFSIDISFQNGIAQLSGNVADQMQRDEAIRLTQAVPGVERVVDRMNTNSGIQQVQADKFPPVPGQAAPKKEGTNQRLQDPMPMWQSPMPSPYDLNPPKMPPYAWPTYAPYNNYSRVAQPQLYPYESWPFIGPMYPFPKIPLGWRSVKLEWEDGHWWYKKVATKHDWWRVRYW